MKLVRVEAPHFVAGLLVDAGGVCRVAAPILKWAIGKDRPFLKAYFSKKGWTAKFVPG